MMTIMWHVFFQASVGLIFIGLSKASLPAVIVKAIFTGTAKHTFKCNEGNYAH